MSVPLQPKSKVTWIYLNGNHLTQNCHVRVFARNSTSEVLIRCQHRSFPIGQQGVKITSLQMEHNMKFWCAHFNITWNKSVANLLVTTMMRTWQFAQEQPPHHFISPSHTYSRALPLVPSRSLLCSLPCSRDESRPAHDRNKWYSRVVPTTPNTVCNIIQLQSSLKTKNTYAIY